ncbi:MAG: hypothetical protein HC888_06820 [Candidatus Competibacteraceae bacterium]|nr:hypothetical protein [Candidatus Competibacteraceae bacterium]
MIAPKLFEIMKSISHIEKDMVITTAKGSYQVRSEEAVLKVLKPKLIQHNLLILLKDMEGRCINSLTEVNGTLQIFDVSDGDSVTIPFYGQGKDGGDKGAGMALTYGVKNALLKTFLVVSGDDADNVSSEVKMDTIESEQLLDRTADVLIRMSQGLPEDKIKAAISWLLRNLNDSHALAKMEDRLK